MEPREGTGGALVAALFGAVLGLGLGGCQEDTDTVSESAPNGAEAADYCNSYAAFLEQDRNSAAGNSPDRFIEEFSATAAAQRSAARTAPPSVRRAQERLALAAEATLEQLRAEAPATAEEADAAFVRIEAEVAAELGGLEEDYREVRAFVNEVCPFSVDQ